jgi:hypothetical protein
VSGLNVTPRKATLWPRPSPESSCMPGLSFSTSANCCTFSFCSDSAVSASTDIATVWILSFRFDAVITTSWISPGLTGISCAAAGKATASAAAHKDSLMVGW